VQPSIPYLAIFSACSHTTYTVAGIFYACEHALDAVSAVRQRPRVNDSFLRIRDVADVCW